MEVVLDLPGLTEVSNNQEYFQCYQVSGGAACTYGLLRTTDNYYISCTPEMRALLIHTKASAAGARGT